MHNSLDLSTVANMRLVWPENTETNEHTYVGINNVFFGQKRFPFDQWIQRDSSRFIFRRNRDGLDSVFCDSQVLDIPHLACKSIHFAGMCAFGYFKEKAELAFSDGTTDYASFAFSDVCYPLFDRVEDLLGVEKEEFIAASRVFFCDRCKNLNVHIYRFAADFESTRILTRIRLPDNILMVIMAVTVEG